MVLLVQPSGNNRYVGTGQKPSIHIPSISNTDSAQSSTYKNIRVHVWAGDMQGQSTPSPNSRPIKTQDKSCHSTILILYSSAMLFSVFVRTKTWAMQSLMWCPLQYHSKQLQSCYIVRDNRWDAGVSVTVHPNKPVLFKAVDKKFNRNLILCCTGLVFHTAACVIKR